LNPVTGRKDYCGPLAFPPSPDSLFRNRGDGSFEDVTATTGVAAEYGPGLGVIASDLNGDAWPDILVANDGMPNILWINDEGKRFRNEGMLRGVGVSGKGAAEGNMGVVLVDMNDDCTEDLFITHFRDQTNTLWVNLGDGIFEDRTPSSGLGPVSLPLTGFGVADLDYDNDGDVDLFVVNGDINVIPEQEAAGDAMPLRQKSQLFRNEGGGVFVDASAAGGPYFQEMYVGRGAAMGDIDNDGDYDVLVTNNHGPALVLENVVGQANPWVGLRLVSGPHDADALGAWVELHESGGRRHCRRVRTDGSYVTARDPRLILGLASTAAVRAEVVWPDGKAETFDGLASGAYHTLRQGGGAP
jgi:hypothetical protein